MILYETLRRLGKEMEILVQRQSQKNNLKEFENV